MNIKLLSLEMKNFKGIKKISISFEDITNIFGENATGKTTIFDAFNWLLFDKDSKGRQVGNRESEFQIKTFDKEGKVISFLNHEVIGVLEADGRKITLSKLYKENWVKSKGQAEKSFDGNETTYSINDIPVKKAEYNLKVNELLAENTFKLISNPLYFNTLNWKNRREILMEIIGDIDSDRVINYNKSLAALSGQLDEGIDNFIKSTKAKIKKLKDKSKGIPDRIDELNNSIVELDFKQLELDKIEIESKIKKVDAMLQSGNKKNDEYFKLKEKLYDLKKELKEKQEEAKEKSLLPLKRIEIDIRNIESDIYDRETIINRSKLRRKDEESNEGRFNETVITLRVKFKDKKNEQFEFNEELGHCTKCLRPYDSENIESAKEEHRIEFERIRTLELERIRAKGHENNEKIELSKKRILELNKEIEDQNELLEVNKTVLKNLKAELEYSTVIDVNVDTIKFDGYENLTEKINDLEEEISDYQVKEKSNDNSNIKAKKREFQDELNVILKDLYKEETNSDNATRINMLVDEEKKISEQIAALEGKEFLAEEFIKTKVELLEGTINKKFKNVSFKLFDIQNNGGLNEACEPLIDGVPFSNANTASQINAGLDIINTLCEHYNVSAPIFIDNRESINQIIDVEGQVINLIVSKDKKLVIGKENEINN